MGSNQNRFLLASSLSIAGIIAFLVAVVTVHPSVFTMTGDGMIYFLPHIKSHTDELLRGGWPRLFWTSGAGWSPFESTQVGVTYFPYHLSNLIARMAGHPLWLLEISGWLHVALAAIVSNALLIKVVPSNLERSAWCFLLAILPGSFIMGINWHCYISAYPWFLWLLLWSVTRAQASPSARGLVGLTIVHAMFFWSAHPQVYAIGMLWLLCWVVAIKGYEGRYIALALVLSAIPHLPAFWHLKELLANASPEYMLGRFSPSRLQNEQGLDTVLLGMMGGNLFGNLGFRTWIASPEGVGVFFCPLLPLVLIRGWKRQRRLLLLLLLMSLLLMAPRSFPFLAELTTVKIGFRWTWKLSWFVGPTVIVAWLLLRSDAKGSRTIVSKSLLGGLVAITALVSLVGSNFNLFGASQVPSLRDVNFMVDSTRRVLRKAGLEPGTRLVILDGWSIGERTKSPLFPGLTGVAPILSGFETAHSYEPLEPAIVADAHMGLSVPWRRPFSSALLMSDPANARAALEQMGVGAILSRHSRGLDPQRTVALDLGEGEWLFVEKLSASIPYPYGTSDGMRVPVERRNGGALLTRAASPRPPENVVGRKFEWAQRKDGRWLGTPVVYASFMPVLTGLAWVLWLGMIAFYVWTRNRIRVDANGL